MRYGHFEHVALEVVLSGPDAPATREHVTFAAYLCACGAEGVAPCPDYAFPVCGTCGQPVMPEREALETRRGEP